MNINLTRQLLQRQAFLIQGVSVRKDENTGETIHLTLETAYDLLAETYGIADGKTLLSTLMQQEILQ